MEQQSKMTMRLAIDVRRAIEQWAEDNLSTMTCELNRSVRERVQRERWERAKGTSAKH
jgi:hypothetical protein